jgi:hypothetical protein
MFGFAFAALAGAVAQVASDGCVVRAGACCVTAPLTDLASAARRAFSHGRDPHFALVRRAKTA